MVSTNTYQAQANELSQKLWAIANELRGQMDASEFKNYILGVIFYRYLSERTEMYFVRLPNLIMMQINLVWKILKKQSMTL